VREKERDGRLKKVSNLFGRAKRILPSLLGLAAFALTAAGQTNAAPLLVADARTLFLKNCAHCHAADGSGDEGPDLHGIGWTDAEIEKRIRNGKKGQMTAFAGKLQPAQIDALAKYVQSLK